MVSKKHPEYHRQYKSVDYTHSAKPALLLETSCQFSTGTGILVSMKLSWCWAAPRGLLSMRRMGLFWIVSTRSRWGKKKIQKDKEQQTCGHEVITYKQLQLSTTTMRKRSSMKGQPSKRAKETKHGWVSKQTHIGEIGW